MVPLALRAMTDLVCSVALGVSVRSRSAKAIEPVSRREEPSLMAPTTSVAVRRVPSLTVVTLMVAVRVV